MRKYRNGRQNASSFRASIVTADKALDAMGWNTMKGDGVPDASRWSTLTCDRVLNTTAEILQRLIEYFRNLHKHHNGQRSARCYMMEYSNGRWSSRYDRMEYSHGRHNTCHDGRSTPTADRISNAILWIYWKNL